MRYRKRGAPTELFVAGFGGELASKRRKAEAKGTREEDEEELLCCLRWENIPTALYVIIRFLVPK